VEAPTDAHLVEGGELSGDVGPAAVSNADLTPVPAFSHERFESRMRLFVRARDAREHASVPAGDHAP